MKTKKDNRYIRSWLFGIIMCILFGQLLPYVGTRLLGAIGVLSSTDYFQIEFMKFNLNSLFIGILLYFIYFYIIKMEDRIVDGDSLHLFKLKLMDIILYILIGLSLSVLNGYISDFAGRIFIESSKILLVNAETWKSNNIWIDILMIGFIGPIAQEIAYRHSFPKFIYRRYSIKMIILLQAIFFGAVHMNIIQGIYGTVAGSFIMIAVLWMDNLYVGILIHCSTNIYSTAISPLLYKYGINLNVFLIILLVPLLIIAYKKRQYDALDRNNPYWK